MGDIAARTGEGAESEGNRGSLMIERKSEKFEERGEVGEQLLPGIPDEITLDLVAPKLPWTAFHILSSVSRGWQQAIQSHQVYDARVRNQTTHTLIVTNQSSNSSIRDLPLFSSRDGSCYNLPPIPGLRDGFPWLGQCNSLNGKLYVLGGYKTSHQASNKAYVLDVAGQKHWKECASMAEPRGDFGSGVLNGKIYVFGGKRDDDSTSPYCGCEVYDPKADAWSPIAPMESLGLYPQIVPTGDELFVHFEGSTHWCPDEDFPLEVYSPLKNQWRSMGMHKSIGVPNRLLAVEGKLCKLNKDGMQLDMYDSRANAWNTLQTFSLGVLESRDSVAVSLLDGVAVDGELLCVALSENPLEPYFLKSHGLSFQKREVKWQKFKCDPTFVRRNYRFYCTIQL